jgi:hypothetical protein
MAIGGMASHELPMQEEVLNSFISGKVMATVFWDMKGTITTSEIYSYPAMKCKPNVSSLNLKRK